MATSGEVAPTGVAKVARQYKLLMWKNFLLLRRSPFRVCVEIIWPLVLFFILAAVRSRGSLIEGKSECHFHNKPMPSAGLVPFFQGIVCLSNNTCIEHEVTDELSGRLTGFETTRVEQLINDTAKFLSNKTQTNVLRDAVEELQKVSYAYDKVQNADEPLGDLLGIDEPTFYKTLEDRGVPLSNKTVDLLLTSVTVNNSALLDELFRIQDRNPDFVPLLETFFVDLVGVQGILRNDSQLLAQAVIEDFATSLGNVPNFTLPSDANRDRLGQLTLTGINTTDVLNRLQNAQSPDEFRAIIGNALDQSNLGEQAMAALDLTSAQQQILTTYCSQEANKNTSTCLLYQFNRNNGTGSTTVLNNLCNQPEYDGLVTCMLWDFTNARNAVDASALAATLCQHHLLTNSSLCKMVQVQQRLMEILVSVDPKEVLCRENTTVLIYNSAEAEMEVKDPICNMTTNQTRILLETIIENVNVTALRELYFPDGFDPEVLLKLARQLQELRNMPSVQGIIADVQDIMNRGFGVSFCGSASDVPIFAPLAALQSSGDIPIPALPAANLSVSTSAVPSSTTPTLEKMEEDIKNDAIAEGEFQNHNSTEWLHHQHCRNLFRSAVGAGDGLGEFLFKQLEPILFGKIPYSPATAEVNETIKRANETFRAIAAIKQAANEIRTNYISWERTINNLGRSLEELERILDLVNQGDGGNAVSGDPPLVSRQQFLEVMLGLASQSGLPLDVSQVPTNVTAIVEQLRNLSAALEVNGSLWRTVDQLGSATGMIYQYLDCVELNKFEPFSSEFKLENRSVDLIKDGRYWAAIVFNDSLLSTDGLPLHISYKIRMNTDKVDGTERIEDKYWRPRPRARPPGDTKYITFGFAYLQDMIEHSLISIVTNDAEKVGIYLQQFPYPCYNVDYFVRGISRSLPLFMVLSWIFSVALLVKSIVYEKQERLKEQMKIMGLTNGIHWFAWYTVSIILIAPSIFCLCLIFKYLKVLQASDPSVIALLLFAFSFSTTCQAFLFSVFFTKANLAACCGAIFYFALYLPYAVVYQFEEDMTDWMKGFSCLLSPVAFGLGTTYISRYEEQGVGIHWSNINSSPLPGDTYSLLKCVSMLFLDGILYFIFAWYKENVFPGMYGVPKPFYFFLTKSFWCGTSTAPSPHLSTSHRSDSYNLEQSQPDNCEVEPTHLRMGVQLKNLTKVYSSGKKLAVDGLSLNLYEDQITSFLGHNGAGKTTTMSILCGLFTPTDGTALVYDKDIRYELDEVRKSMGFCPQFNVLYDMLTVSEHILFYGQLKGLSYEQARKEMMTMLEATGMLIKKDAMTKSLSGGMKRKLSVMCAFVGGSKCVVLDEPTAGVDPYSRRQIWELLLNFKHGRTILLSTHHMDEADFLGDRIAIISHGKLCCVGSSLYLKGLHGNGYYLTLVRSNDRDTVLSMEDTIEKFVTTRVPGSVLMESVGQEMVFQLPSSEVKTGAFIKLFNDLDSNLEKLELTSYGICDTTLEEVFLKIAEDTGVDTEDLLTDGGLLAMPARRESLRLKTGAQRAFGKLKEKLSKLKAKKSASTYARQLDDDGMASASGLSMSNISEADPVAQNASNSERTDSYTRYVTADGETTDDALSDDDDVAPVAAAGQLSISFSSTNGQVDANITPVSADGESKTNKLKGWRLVIHQMKALVIKRFHHVRRDKVAFLCEIVLPAAFILLAMAFALAVPPVHPQPPIELQPWMYEPVRGDKHLNFFFRNEYVGSEFTQGLEELVTEAQYGTRCMNPNIYQIEDKPCNPALKSSSWTKQTNNISPTCSCDTGYQQCEAIPNMPSNITLPNSDYLLNMTGQNVSEWLVKTMQPYIKKRYGGFSFNEGGSKAYVNESDILGIIQAALPNASNAEEARDMADAIEDLLDSVNIHKNIKVWFNNKGWTASVSYMNAANNLLLKHKLKKSARRLSYRDFGITAINHPMNRTDYQFQQEVMNRGYVTLLISLCVIFAMSLIPATFVLYLIMDRVSTSKSLQYVSGMNRMVYWVTNFMWDMFNYIVCASLCFLIFLAFDEKAYVGATNGPCLALLMLLYGWAMIPFMYPFSYIFRESSMAYVVLACMNIFIGIVSTVSTFILEAFPDQPELNEISEQLKKAFLIFPHYCLGRALIDMSVEHLKKEVAEILGTSMDYDPFSFDITGKNMLAMFVQGCVFFFLVIMIEYKFFYHRKPTAKPVRLPDQTEDDVLAEEVTVREGTRPNDVLVAKDLTKLFGSLRAVNGLSFGVPTGQCFGLLGVNGAGKTTTFRMLTGIDSADGGDAFIQRLSISQDPTQVQQLIGYCPQFDAIDPLLTVTEHLEYYARLRGVANKYVTTVATTKLKKMGLIKYKNKKAGDLSGGNKRKLQSAIALIGNPSLIFMDEPTTGMDPKARRFLWDSIIKINKEGHSVVLTSHSMEECEVLCNRLAIMVNGTFRCLGTPQHLKNKYGEGYHVTIRVARGTTPDIGILLNAMETEFHSSSMLLESSLLMAQYHISSKIPVADIFFTLEKIRDRCAVEDYSVTQTSLDHVFIRFAKQQTDVMESINLMQSANPDSISIGSTSTAGNSQVNLIV